MKGAARIVILGVLLLSFAVTLVWYPYLSDPMATHWNASGDPDGYMPRTFGALLIPVVMLITVALLFLVPRLDPLRANIDQFREYYEGFILILGIFLLGIQFFVLLWNTGVRINPNAIIPPGIGLLIIYTGILLGRAKRNWFIGIRTPWTLSSDRVWERTHRLGRTLFILSGSIALLGFFFQEHAWLFVLVPLLAASAITVVFSCLDFSGEGNRLEKAGLPCDGEGGVHETGDK